MAEKKTAKRSSKKKNGQVSKAYLNGQHKPFKAEDHLSVNKTYKLYIGGAFPRTESGRYYKVLDLKGDLVANACRGSRKDFRNAVVAARRTFKGWSARSAFNRSQILYRIAEMLEWRKDQFINELIAGGSTKAQAKKEVELSIDRLVYYAGWADKYQQVFSAVNPVASSHFNFSILEPTGVVSAFAPDTGGLLGLISIIAPAITGGNTIVILANDKFAAPAISFAEVLHTSDLPGGVVNILTGFVSELTGHFSSHMDVNAIVYCGNDEDTIKEIQTNSTKNLKRARIYPNVNWLSDKGQSPYFINDLQETKTTWHPIGAAIDGGGPGY